MNSFKIWFHGFIILLIKLIYDIAMGYPRKNPQYTFLRKTLGIFKTCHFTLRNSEENKVLSLPQEILCRIVWHLLQISRSKTKDPWMEIPHEFFLKTPRNSTSFLIHPWDFHMLFLQYSLKFHVLDPPSLTSYIFIHCREK